MYKGKAAKILAGIETGDRVRIDKSGKSFEGHLIPRTELGDENHIVIKLDSGYNIGIDITKAAVEKLRVAGKPKKAGKPGIGMGMERVWEKPNVTIIGTGGTIASKVDYRTGAVHPSFSTGELINAVPELKEIANIDTRLLFNILSENMTPSHWKEIADEVARELNSGAGGVIVAHGTDTLGYTAAALSFMLKNLHKPVVLVGSQRSSDRPSSDASLNLIHAAKVAVSDIGEVAVVMHGSSSDDFCLIHRGTKVRKMHSSRRNAFKSVNDVPIGEVNEGGIKTYQGYRKRKDGKNGNVEVDGLFDRNVAFLRIHPGIKEDVLDYYVDNYNGIVLEGTGLGHVPENLLLPIKRAGEKGIPVVMTTQTIFGRVNMKVYSTGRELLERGVISGMDMLPEVAYVKLMYVLGHTKDLAEVGRMMQEDIAGEICKRSREDGFLCK
jgi:glutamyl-tRNA(Gln) amidotransferase subunit D